MILPQTEPRLIGNSAAIQSIAEDVDAAALSSAKVLITGETGVGKEVIASLIHGRSSRRSRRLTTVNCAGVPDTLLESELFGHVRGSFTGAYRDKPGILEMADEGTVFLDEVGEMSSRMQAMLLRFLETGELQRVGADRAHKCVAVRVLAATNRDLASQVASGAFRADLYYRLNVIRIAVPPLRERRDDIPAFIAHFLAIFSAHHHVPEPTIDETTMDALVRYSWPGNIRELKNVIERLTIRSRGGTIGMADLPREFCEPVRVDDQASGHRSQRDVKAADELVTRLIRDGEPFWTAVHGPFMSRDLTRQVVRDVVAAGLRKTSGNYRMLTRLFNIEAEDYKRFLGFLRKYDCQVGFRAYRVSDRRQAKPDSVQRAGVAS